MNSPISFLEALFKDRASECAFIHNENEYTYEWLLNRIEHWAGQLQNCQIDQGHLVGLSGDYSPETVSLLLALAKARAISIPLSSVTPKEKEDFLKIGEYQHEFVFEKDVLLEMVQVESQPQNPLIQKLIRTQNPGVILFSSGSSGKPKGILHDFSKVLEKFKTPRQKFRTLPFLQLDHMGGINTLLYALSNGGTLCTLKERSPRRICELIEKYRLDLLPVTPTFLNLLIVSGEYKNFNLSSLKVITYGTEVMSELTLRRAREIFPQVKFQQTYGLSEIGVMRTKSKDDGSLWVKVGGSEFQTKVKDGILWIKADSAMLGYLNVEEQPFDAEGWFNTQDQVEVQGEYFKILGRKSDLINIGGQKVFPSEVEEVLMQIPNVTDAVICAEKTPLFGNIMVAKLSLRAPEEPSQLSHRVMAFCKDKLSAYKIPRKILIHSEPTYNQRFKKIRKAS